MDFITDNLIESLILNNEIGEFLQLISEKDINQRLIVNFILYIFYSECMNSELDYVDWVNIIISAVEKNRFTTNMLVPKLKQVSGINLIFNDTMKLIYDLYNCGKVNINDYCITYDMFNEYIDVLYVWFKDNFEIN